MGVQLYLFYPAMMQKYYENVLYSGNMDIVYCSEVRDRDLNELSLACFDHTHSKDRLDMMIRSDGRLPDWGGELYAVEDETALGVVGILYPRAKTKEEVITVGGIRHVCSRPSTSRKGVAERLMIEAHNILKKKVRYSFLMTSASGVAHHLYEKLGYEDIYVPGRAFKKRENARSDVSFKRKKAPDYVRSVYTESVEGLTGLVVRDGDFWNMAQARGWPDNENVKLAYKDGERIGYVMIDSKRDRLEVKEIGAKKGFLPEILKGLDSQTDCEFLVLSYVNPKYREKIEESGYHWTDDMWYRVMVNDLSGGSNTSEKFGAPETFQMGIYESF